MSWPGRRVAILALLAATVGWGSLIVLTPHFGRADAGSARVAAAAAYLFGSTVCHQRPDRSFHIAGVRLPVCTRCTGLYLAAPFGLLLAARRRRSETHREAVRLLLMASAVPTLVTVLLEVLRVWQPSGVVRALAAIPLGAAVAWIVGATLRADLR